MNRIKKQESTNKNKPPNSARVCTDAVVNYLGSSTNRELQAYYEDLITVWKILTKESQQKSGQTKPDKLDLCLTVHHQCR